jgi:3-isopropylmalate/(R)-2-methylmalate dehydratase small subunit
METLISGKAFVVGDNIDTDQIIPAEYLTLSHTIPEQREEIAKYAMIGLPDTYPKFIQPGKNRTEYPIIVGGENFGCGSSRAQAPGCLNAAGVKAVVAHYYARIFFRNSVNAGLLTPITSELDLSKEIKTGDMVEIDLNKLTIINKTQNKTYQLKELGAVKDILEAGDVFEYAKKLVKKN